jgi:type IV secretory pathway TraG/TraD family ATPase VirD4
MSKDRFYTGIEWLPQNRWFHRTANAVYVDLDKIAHCIIIAPTAGGKGATIEIPNRLLPGLRHVNIVGVDPAGQNAIVTRRWRSKFSDFQPLNPLNVHGLGDVGCNPLLSVKNFQDAMRVGEAMQEVKATTHEPFWPEASQGLIGGVVLAVVKDCKGKRTPTLEMVREILTCDLEGFAAHMDQCGDFQLKSLLNQYQKSNRTIDSIKINAHNATKWSLDEDITKSLSVDKGIDWTQLKDGARPQTIELILPAQSLDTFAPWLRLMMVSAFNALYQSGGGGGRKTVFMLSEFYALGRIGPVFLNAMTQIRKFDGRFCPIVLQNVDQVAELFGQHGSATIFGNSGAVLAFAPAPTDNATAEFLSKAAGNQWLPNYSYSDDPHGGPPRGTVGMREERLWPPEAIRSLPEFCGLLFMDGARPTPVWLPRYFKPDEFPELQGRYDADPYHPASPAASRSFVGQVGKVTGIAVASAAVIGGGVLLSQAAGHGQIWHPHGSPAPVVRADPPKANPPARVQSHPVKPQHARR